MTTGSLHDMIVAELMDRWPDTIPVFMRRRMACPGCLMAPFMTVAEAAAEHGIRLDDLSDELRLAIACPPARSEAPA